MKQAITYKIICGFPFFILLFVPLSFSQADNQITLTTYYPSPFGSYHEVEIRNQVTFRAPNGGIANVQIRTDNDGNFIVNSNKNFSQIVFGDVSRPFCYLQPYVPGGGITTCATGYMAVNFLDSDHIPANPTSLPASGFIVCLRGWEEP